MSSTQTKTTQPPADIRQHALGNLQYIRDTMDSAGEFTSVPGRGGVAMGVVALIAAGLSSQHSLERHWLTVWLIASVVGVILGCFFLVQKTRRQQQDLLNSTARRFFWSLTPPLLAGAALTLGLILQQSYQLIPSAWLLTYGAGVLATGSFSIRPVAAMGACFMVLGVVALFVPFAWTNSLLALGFGGLHLFFGLQIARFHGG